MGHDRLNPGLKHSSIMWQGSNKILGSLVLQFLCDGGKYIPIYTQSVYIGLKGGVHSLIFVLHSYLLNDKHYSLSSKSITLTNFPKQFSTYPRAQCGNTIFKYWHFLWGHETFSELKTFDPKESTLLLTTLENKLNFSFSTQKLYEHRQVFQKFTFTDTKNFMCKNSLYVRSEKQFIEHFFGWLVRI